MRASNRIEELELIYDCLDEIVVSLVQLKESDKDAERRGYGREEIVRINNVVTFLLHVGEQFNSSKLSKELLETICDEEELEFLRGFAGLRNVIAHNYRGLDESILWNIFDHEVDRLIDLSEDLICKVKNELAEY